MYEVAHDYGTLPMSFIEVIPPKRADGATADVYRYMNDVAGGGEMAAKIVQMFSLRPESMRRMIRTWELAMWVGSQPRTDREMIAAMVSRFNNCDY